MGFKLLSAAVMVAVFGATAGQAQSVGKLGGPSNLPPAGFKGQQFVDNRGCVFLKAGYGGQVTWVPRVGRDRKALCGYPPTFGEQPVIEVATAEEMAPKAQPAPEPVAKAAPVVVVKPQAETIVAAAPAPDLLQPKPLEILITKAPAQQPAPYAKAAPVVSQGYEVAETGPGPGKIGCYTSAPVPERVKLRNGGTAVVCTRGDGTLAGWRPPVYPKGAGVGASLTDPVQVARGTITGSVGYVDGYAEATSNEVPVPPKGYKLAWKDDRLNPLRGKGTAEGWAQQAQVWTDQVPARLVTEKPAAKRKAVVVASKGAAQGTSTTLSTKGQAVEPVATARKVKAAAGGLFVQVGTFGVPANAEGAASRLSGLGLPVARSKITRSGKAMQIVLAGPFASAADAQVALSMTRGAGFGDAFIR